MLDPEDVVLVHIAVTRTSAQAGLEGAGEEAEEAGGPAEEEPAEGEES